MVVNIPPPPPSMVVNISPPPALHGGEILTTPHKALTKPSPTGQAEHNDDLGVCSPWRGEEEGSPPWREGEEECSPTWKVMQLPNAGQVYILTAPITQCL